MSKYYLYALEKCLGSIVTEKSSVTNESALCLTMCPPEEIQKRISNTHGREFTVAEQQDRIHVLEGADPSIIDEFTNIPIKQEDLLVKVYARSNDQETKQPSILRPPHILEKTVLHLIHYCLRVGGTNDPRLRDRAVLFSDVYAFVHDRFKMVHRDAIWQGTSAHNQVDVLIRVHEIMCRFLILITHYCYGDTDFLSSRDKSLDKWFAELIDLYTLAIKNEQYEYCSNCGEFLGYYVIYFYSLRQRAKNDHITFTSNLSKAQLILSSVVSHLSEPLRQRNMDIFSDAVNLIANMEPFNLFRLNQSFKKAHALLVILLFYGNIGMLRWKACVRLWRLCKNETPFEKLEEVLFCDSDEIGSILTQYGFQYNPETHSVKQNGSFINTILTFTQPVSFIQQKISCYSLEDIVFGASAEYPLSPPESSLTLKAILHQPLAPDAISLFHNKNDSMLPTYFCKEVDTVKEKPAEKPLLPFTEKPTKKSSGDFVLADTPFGKATETGLFTKPFEIPNDSTPSLFGTAQALVPFSAPTQTPIPFSVPTSVPFSASIPPPSLLQQNSPPNDTPQIALCLKNDSKVEKINISSVFQKLSEQPTHWSPFMQYSFSTCTVDKHADLESCDEDDYVFSSLLSQEEMEKQIQHKKEEEERKKEEEERKEKERKEAEERKKKEAEERKRLEEKKKKEEKERQEKEKKRKEEEERKQKLDAVVQQYKQSMKQEEERMKQFEKQMQQRLKQIDRRIEQLTTRTQQLQKQAKKVHDQKQAELRQYYLSNGASFCHVFGSLQTYFRLHSSMKRPAIFSSPTLPKRVNTQCCNLLYSIPIHEQRHLRVSFGSADGCKTRGFLSFLSLFNQNGSPLNTSNYGYCGNLAKDLYYRIEVVIEEKNSTQNDIRFEYHPILSSSSLKTVRGGKNVIECIDCPIESIPSFKQTLRSIQHVVFLNEGSVIENLEKHYKSILQEAVLHEEPCSISLSVGELFWNLICLTTYQQLPQITVNTLKSALITTLMSLIQNQCEMETIKQMKTDIFKSIVNYASLYKYCFENKNMQLIVSVKEEDVKTAIQSIKQSIETRSSTLPLDSLEEPNLGEQYLEAVKKDVLMERMNTKLYLSHLRDVVNEGDLPEITINESDLLF